MFKHQMYCIHIGTIYNIDHIVKYKCLFVQVSLMSRMIPSPDWFIGIDSFDLCVNGNWLDSITIEVSIILSRRAPIHLV